MYIPSVLDFRLRAVCFLALFVAIGLMSGCAGVHTYDGAKDKLAQGVKTRYEELNLTQHLALQRKNLEKLLAQEKDVAGQVTDQLRDQESWLLAQGHKTGGFDESAVQGDEPLGRQLLPNFTASKGKGNYPTERLRILGIESDESLVVATKILGALGKGAGTDPIERDIIVVNRARQMLEFSGWKNVWSCDRVLSSSLESATAAAGETGQKPAFARSLKNYRKACQEFHALANTQLLLGDGKGAIRNAYEEWRKSQDELDTLTLAQRKAREVIAGLKPKEGEQGSTPIVERLQKKAVEISELLVKLGDEPAGNDEADKSLKRLGIEQVLTRLRINDLGILLKAVHNESLEGLDNDEAARLKEKGSLRRAAVLAAGLPGFGNSVEALIRHLRSPDARAGLLIHYTYQSARLDYLNQRAALVKERADLQRDLLRALLEEADYFEEIRQFVAPEKPNDLRPDLSKKTLAKVWEVGTPQEKRNLYHVLIAFENSFSVARRRGETVKYQVAATWERQGVLADEYALNAWNSVLAGPMEQLAAYHGSGVKPETVARIFSGLMGLGILGYIGVKEAN